MDQGRVQFQSEERAKNCRGFKPRPKLSHSRCFDASPRRDAFCLAQKQIEPFLSQARESPRARSKNRNPFPLPIRRIRSESAQIVIKSHTLRRQSPPLTSFCYQVTLVPISGNQGVSYGQESVLKIDVHKEIRRRPFHRTRAAGGAPGKTHGESAQGHGGIRRHDTG